MDIELSPHAEEERQRRGISMALLEQVLNNPQQTVPSYGNRKVYQSKMVIDGKSCLLRIVVNETVLPKRVITVYRTNKINKYWRENP